MLKSLIPYISLLIPLFLKYLFILIFGDIKVVFYVDILEDIIFFLIISFAFNISRFLFYRLTLLLLYVLYFILETTSYLAVSANFSSSYMYVLIETTKAEFGEFVHSYGNKVIIASIVFMILSFLYIKRRMMKVEKINKYVSLILGLVLIVLLKLTGLIENNVYHNVVRGIYGYYKLQHSFNLANNLDREDIEVIKENDVLVIVLGESTTRGHMNLYGYRRNTTPFLSGFRDSLLIYDNVISTDVLTLKAVPKMITSICNSHENNENMDLVSVFNASGYSTYWLSNQRPISYHDNAISQIASHSTFFKFYNYKIEKYTTSTDEILLPDYYEILNEPGKKVIFLRLIGTHFDYHKRYPKSFNKFDKPGTSKKQTIINQYDNAVLYNDFILKSILESLEKVGGKTALMYLSDHGENVYDDGDFIGRVETNLKKNMFEIPFLVWTSKDFELPDDFEYVPNRKFMADHFYESALHLFGVKYKGVDAGNSIFSKEFKERNRIVVNGVDYDKQFLNKNE
ncbi:phosphoethanolamine transferase [Flavobacteriaceae bacterium SZ-1-7]|uniref:phosphoethanolamine transferase n=1 Tax=Tamlana sedimenti TaxID=3134126 RepID=UPI00312B001D